MKYIVCVVLTPDTEQLSEVQPQDVLSGDLGVTMVLNPWDEFAVEEALQLQEQVEGETVALALGSQESVEALRRAIAMGIESAVLLSDPAFDGSDAWGTARVLAQAIQAQGDYGLILAGKQSVDGASGLVAAGIAAHLGVPFLSQVAKVVEITEDSITARRVLDEGVQTVRTSLPAVISVSKEINEPRYPNFVGVRKAARMAYPAATLEDLPGLDAGRIGSRAALIEWTNLRKPPARKRNCQFIEGATAAEQAATLVDRLIAEKVI
jgi:electron transfer flavoprotein beta subunit